jgi:hypothetical protein
MYGVCITDWRCYMTGKGGFIVPRIDRAISGTGITGQDPREA